MLVIAAVAAAGLHDPMHPLQTQTGRMALVLVCAVVGLICEAIALLAPTAARLGWLSGLSGVLCLLATVFIWVCVAADTSLNGAPPTVVTNNTQSAKAVAAQGRAAQRPIHTGVLIETMQFTDTHNVRLTGYLWQRLPADAAPDTAAVELPDAIDGGATERVYHYRDGDKQVVGLRLRTTLREKFDYPPTPWAARSYACPCGRRCPAPSSYRTSPLTLPTTSTSTSACTSTS